MKVTGSTTLIIFGVSGDLASRKLLPALYWLLKAEQLPANFHIIGVSRRDVSAVSLAATMSAHLDDKADEATVQRLEKMMEVVQMDSGQPDDYGRLIEVLHRIEKGQDSVRLLHLSLPPSVSAPVIAAMHAAGLIGPKQKHTRLLLEKPFGFDLQSAERLNAQLHAALHEDQIYRIDHYLAKETAQNISVFRFQNPIVAALWNAEHIDRIEIEASEAMGIEGRVNFYEQTGALRDVVQSHLLSLMALVMMEEPTDGSATALHKQRQKVLEAVRPIAPNEVTRLAMRGQYEGYRDEVGSDNSTTETFAALKLMVETARWKGVHVTLSGGKALDAKRTEIRVYFRSSPEQNCANRLTMRVQPEEGIELQLEAKRPGLTTDTAPVRLDYSYGKASSGRQPDGYERVLLEAMAGDRANFLTGPEVIATWKLAEPILHHWQRRADDLISYQPGATVVDIINPTT